MPRLHDVWGGTSEEDSGPIIDRALEAGINFLDTANVYGRGVREEVLGRALRRNGQRSKTILATKVHGRMADDDPNAAGSIVSFLPTSAP